MRNAYVSDRSIEMVNTSHASGVRIRSGQHRPPSLWRLAHSERSKGLDQALPKALRLIKSNYGHRSPTEATRSPIDRVASFDDFLSKAKVVSKGKSLSEDGLDTNGFEPTDRSLAVAVMTKILALSPTSSNKAEISLPSRAASSNIDSGLNANTWRSTLVSVPCTSTKTTASTLRGIGWPYTRRK